ncbi:MAG: nucleotidyltransferase family protein [Gemmatimonadota bacterium]
MRIAREPEVVRWVFRELLDPDHSPAPAPALWQGMPAVLLAGRLSPLAVHLLGPRIGDLRPEERRPLEAADLDAQARSHAVERQLRQLASLLDETPVRWVVIKGWPLAARLYPTPACRPSVDLDLLVAGTDHAEVARVFMRAGYGETTTPATATYHRSFRPPDGSHGVPVELHSSPEPWSYQAPLTSQILGSRVRYRSPVGPLWIPGPSIERDLLIRHYCRHAGSQAILLLDLLLALRGSRMQHELGALIALDLDRLDLEPVITGPSKARQAPLHYWMSQRTFHERRTARLKSPLGMSLALARSPGAFTGEVLRFIWPRFPTSRWCKPGDPSRGIPLWRVRRLLSLGR